MDFAIVLKDIWEHQLCLSLSETVQSGKQWNTWAPRCWLNWKHSVRITSSSLCLYSSTHAFLSASLQKWSLFIAFPVFQGWQSGGKGAIDWNVKTYAMTSRLSPFRQLLSKCYVEVAVCCHIKTKLLLFNVKLFATFTVWWTLFRFGLRLNRSYFNKADVKDWSFINPFSLDLLEKETLLSLLYAPPFLSWTL